MSAAPRRFWAVTAAVGAAVLAATALPATRIELDGGTFRIAETVRLLTAGSSRGIAVVACGLVLLVVGVVALRRDVPRAFVALATLAASVATLVGIQTLAYLTTNESGYICSAYPVSRTVYCGGPVLGPELSELYADKAPVTTGEDRAEELTYRAPPRFGIWLLLAAAAPFSVAALYRTARLRITRRWLAIVLVTAVTLVALFATFVYLTFANYYD